MTNHGRTLALLLAGAAACAASGEEKWKFAGENQGVAFHLRISDQCRDGSKVAIQLRNTLDETVTVSFRLNDADWRKTFTRELRPRAKDATLSFAPEEGMVCHPYIDQVYVETQQERVTHTEDSADEGP